MESGTEARDAKPAAKRARKATPKVAEESPTANANGNGPEAAEVDKNATEPVSMTDVEGTQPSLAESVAGRLDVERESVNYQVCEDGITHADVGWCGTVADGPNFKAEIRRLHGGGTYIVRGIDETGGTKAARVTIAGPSKPIPGSTGYADPNAGAFEGYSATPGAPSYSAYPPPPFYGPQPGYTPFSPYAPEPHVNNNDDGDEEKARLRAELADVQRQREFERLERSYDDKLSRLVDEIRDLKSDRRSGGGDFGTMLIAMMDQQFKQSQLAAQERARADEARWQAERADRDAREKREASLLQLQMSAFKDSSAANSSAAMEVAKAHAGANDKVMEILAKRSDDVGLVERGMRLATEAASNKSAVAEGIAAAREIIPAVVEGVVQVKSLNAGQPPAGGGVSDDDMIARMAALLAKLCIKQAAPEIAVATIAGACDVSGFDVAKLDPLIAIGTPSTCAILLENAASKAVDENNKKKMLEAKNLLLTDAGGQWFKSLRSVYLNRRGVAQPVPQVAGPGPAGQAPGRAK